HPAVHAVEPEQPDRLDGRTQRRRRLRQAGGLRLPEVAANRWSIADRSADRSKLAVVRAVHLVESAGFANLARAPARRTDWPLGDVCRADLSTGGTQSNAGVAHRCFGDAREARVWPDVQ